MNTKKDDPKYYTPKGFEGKDACGSVVLGVVLLCVHELRLRLLHVVEPRMWGDKGLGGTVFRDVSEYESDCSQNEDGVSGESPEVVCRHSVTTAFISSVTTKLPDLAHSPNSTTSPSYLEDKLEKHAQGKEEIFYRGHRSEVNE